MIEKNQIPHNFAKTQTTKKVNEKQEHDEN